MLNNYSEKIVDLVPLLIQRNHFTILNKWCMHLVGVGNVHCFPLGKTGVGVFRLGVTKKSFQ